LQLKILRPSLLKPEKEGSQLQWTQVTMFHLLTWYSLLWCKTAVKTLHSIVWLFVRYGNWLRVTLPGDLLYTDVPTQIPSSHCIHCQFKRSNCIALSPCIEANSLSLTREFRHIVWNTKVLYSVQNSLQIIPFLGHITLVSDLSSYFCKTHFNITLPYNHRNYKWPLSFRFSH
jgi:hypothetical protein